MPSNLLSRSATVPPPSTPPYRSSRLAAWGFALSLGGLCLGWVWSVLALLVVPGFVLSLVALLRTPRRWRGRQGWAIAGLVVSVGAWVASMAFTLVGGFLLVMLVAHLDVSH